MSFTFPETALYVMSVLKRNIQSCLGRFSSKMKLEISEDILRKTRCKKDFSCLSGERSDLCKVELRADGQVRKVIFLKNLKDKSCTYAKSFGYAYICNCPVRKEIYDTYWI
jgi:hypothetical protein